LFKENNGVGLVLDKSKIRISSEIDNSKHEDDESFVHIGSDKLVAVVADGVSGCTCGRLASKLVVGYLLEKIPESSITNTSISDIVTEAVNRSKITFNDLKESWIKRPMIEHVLPKLLKQYRNLETNVNTIKTNLAIYQTLEGEVERKELFEIIERDLQNLQTLEEETKQLIGTIEQYAKDNTEIQIFLPRFKKTLNSLSKDYSIENDYKEILSISVPSFPDFSYTLLDKLIEICKKFQLSDENYKQTAIKIFNRLTSVDPNENDNIQDVIWDVETTLSLLVLTTNKGILSYCLGDSPIRIYRNKCWIYHSFPITRGAIKSFISLTRGIVGEPDIVYRCTYRGDIIINSSDGALLEWTTPGGVEYVPFEKLLRESLKNDTIKSVSDNLINKIREKGDLKDDASLIVIQLR